MTLDEAPEGGIRHTGHRGHGERRLQCHRSYLHRSAIVRHMRRAVATRVLLWGPPIVYMLLIFHFSSESIPLPELTEHVWDKILHTIEYAGLAFVLCRALVGEGASWVRAAVVAVVLTSAYGASDEWHQAYVPVRSSDVCDW